MLAWQKAEVLHITEIGKLSRASSEDFLVFLVFSIGSNNHRFIIPEQFAPISMP